jgi:DNA invertase Pin-like site-specific DNA recombinase
VSKRRLGISYGRLSDPKQNKGDGEDRQDKAYRAFCARHDLTPLPPSEKYFDNGLSGYKDHHRKRGRLGQLIAAAKDGAFDAGAVIVVEAWDRLGRLRPDKQLNLIQELLACGVCIGVCRLDLIFTEDSFGTHDWTVLAIFVQLAYQESKQKAERVASSWQSRREKARDTGWKIPGRVPTWLRLEGDDFVEKPEAVAAVRRVFALSAAGYGKRRICHALTAEGVAPLGKSGVWHDDFIDLLLNDRRAVGEYQPRNADKSPAGDVIEGYYPAVVTAEQFALARAGQESRKKKNRPRDRKYVNVFRGLLVNALDGEGFALLNYGTEDKPRLCLSSTAGLDGRRRTQTFPYPDFEEGILSRLAEVRWQDVAPRQGERPDRLGVLRAKLHDARENVAGLKDALKPKFSKSLAELLRDAEADEERVAGELQEELAKAARPAERDWGQLPGLVALVKEKGDDARLRIRAVLRGIVTEARLLLVRRGCVTLAACQFYFAGGAARGYLLAYQSASSNRPRRSWGPLSLTRDEMLDRGLTLTADFDLRQAAHAEALARKLEALDLGRFDGRVDPCR